MRIKPFIFYDNVVSAETASKCVFLTVRWMIDSELTFFLSRACLSLIAASFLMARFTEMSRAEAEPQSNRATVATLKLYGVLSVSFTLAYTDSCSLSNT